MSDAVWPRNKAWMLWSDLVEYTDLVYAPTRNIARRMGFESGELEYIEINARRLRGADQWANEGKMREHDPERLRSLGWWCEDDYGGCDTCGLHDWNNMSVKPRPEWVVCPECHHCGECGHEDDCLNRDDAAAPEADPQGEKPAPPAQPGA